MHNSFIAYVPVIHSGYIKLFEKYRWHDCYLVDPNNLGCLEKFSYLAREARALCIEQTMYLVKAMRCFVDVYVLSVDNIADIVLKSQSIVMADEDVTRWLAETYFQDVSVQFEQLFLRWNWNNVKGKEVVVPDEVISREEFDVNMMNQAIGQSQKSSDWWRQIGVVIVKNHKVLYYGYNEHFPSPHAPYIDGDPRTPFEFGVGIEITSAGHGEASVIARAAAGAGGLSGSSIYVSTFPCPTCAFAIINAGINRVYYSEGYSLVGAAGKLRFAGVDILKVCG